jgi:L-serine dehydratase
MSVFDIIGPVMVGPSSSHTAGAVRLGLAARQLLGEKVTSAQILLYGSFYNTGDGHGTRLAIVAGLMGMKTDDIRIPDSFALAEKTGMKVAFGQAHLKKAHPNTAVMNLTGESGQKTCIQGESIGGGRINIHMIDGMKVDFGGEYPTLIVHNIDKPGYIEEVTSVLSHRSVNIATMHLNRESRGGNAVMVIECDEEIEQEALREIRSLEGVLAITYYSPAGTSGA